MGVVLTVDVAGKTAGTVADLPVCSVRERDRTVTLIIGANSFKTNAQKVDFDNMGTERMV